jgi:hypothetical protein
MFVLETLMERSCKKGANSSSSKMNSLTNREVEYPIPNTSPDFHGDCWMPKEPVQRNLLDLGRENDLQ